MTYAYIYGKVYFTSKTLTKTRRRNRAYTGRMSCHQRCDCPGPVTTVCRPVPVTEAGRRLTQQLFEVRPFNTHSKTIRSKETPTTTAWPMRGTKAGGPRTSKSKCTYGANWDSSVAGRRHKRRRSHHPLASPTIFQQGQCHEPRHQAGRPNDDNKRRLRATPTSSRPRLVVACRLDEGSKQRPGRRWKGMPEGTDSPPPGFMCKSFPPRSQLTGVIASCTGPPGGGRRSQGHAARARPTNRKT